MVCNFVSIKLSSNFLHSVGRIKGLGVFVCLFVLDRSLYVELAALELAM